MKEIFNVLSSAMGQEERLNMIANNLANVNTVGFKQDRALFVDYAKAQAEATGTVASGDASKPVVPFFSGGYTDHSAGSAMPTGGTYDLMIDGEGFFEIESSGGADTFYTRAGNFVLNKTGELTTLNGRRVLDGSGSAITIGSATDVEIAADGTITAGDSNLGKIQAVKFEDTTLLEKYGDGLFRAPSEVVPTADTEGQIRQGYLEGSNVKTIEELVRMIQNQRAFDANQRTIQSIDQAVGARIRGILNG